MVSDFEQGDNVDKGEKAPLVPIDFGAGGGGGGAGG